ncbi:hypothetical protein M430DRAFT_23143 [Amorphotheca resinae ATCC 22711]|uniref:Protein SDS23 n=1 Tax=Amorphotheca resinae ATCC 22711 TaxID=857342 RepID=A0A2T3APR0_AMORE|nr:hypothetical protein M430DRAFT_23143 [Amorphotheca resinae ATCC 22711]PSS06990.1 hypothetical protein M430DRAFT_23143 [Amorphotheca resinae ATCC 22711]
MTDHAISSDPPSRNSTSSPSSNNGPISHRSSFAENLRHSPRSQRHPSLTQAAVQELLNHPPNSKTSDPRFAGRDWRSIHVGELVQKSDVRWAELDTNVQDATKALIDHGPPNVILLRESPTDKTARDSFDYNDLNAYLLVVLGLANPEEDQREKWTDLAKRATAQEPIPLREAVTIAKKSPLVTLSESEDLSKAIEIFGSGIHRIIICKEGTEEVVGILSQLKLVNFLWQNANSFPTLDRLYPMVLRDLGVGTVQAISINGDRNLAEALQLMNNEGLTSVAVVDNAWNVIGNISTADVRFLTTSKALPLFHSSCIHFISVILSERGIGAGKDSFPVFYVNPYSTLAHTVARLVATRSHRMWVVESASPSPSTPATPLAAPSVRDAVTSPQPPPSPSMSSFPAPSISTAALPGARISGRLIGVISLTDILNLFARQSGLNPLSPTDQRDRRRRSSSSSMRPSFDSARASSLDLRR